MGKMISAVGLPVAKRLTSETFTFNNESGTEDKVYNIGDLFGYLQQEVAAKAGSEVVNNGVASSGKTISSIVKEFGQNPIQITGFKFVASDVAQHEQPLEILDVAMDRVAVERRISPSTLLSNKQNLERIVDARFEKGDEVTWHSNRGMRVKVLAGKSLSLTCYFGVQVGRY